MSLKKNLFLILLCLLVIVGSVAAIGEENTSVVVHSSIKESHINPPNQNTSIRVHVMDAKRNIDI